MKRFLRLISIFLIPVLFISCRNLFGNDDYDDSETGYVIQGTITQSEVSDAVYRTAFPAQPAGIIYYRITAKCGAETVEEKSTSASTNFSLKIPHAGGWTVFAEGFTDNDFTTSILKSEEKILRISDESPMGYANLVLKPYVSESGTGNVSLRINLPDPATSPRPISYVTIGGIDFSVGITASVTGNRAVITGSNVKSGSYTVEISFKGTVSGFADVLLYHVTEVINVYDNLTTDTWVKHGDEPYFDNYGNFMIKDAMTQEFQLTTVYVGGEGANDSNNGTFLNPVATFTKAITISGAKNFFITGEVSAESGCSFTPAENGFIKKYPNADEAEILLTESNDDTLITIGSGKTFEISNITIAGPGSSSIRTKSGIVNNGNLTLNNCFIKGFECNAGSTHKGGAINNSTGALTINGGEILGCGAAEGGAIYMAGGSLTIKGTTIIEKNTDKNGNKNNIELASGQTISISGTGTGSHIGITKDFDAVGDSTVQFASDTTENISEKYFSDAGYIIGNTSGKGCIAKTIGVLGAGYYEDVKFDSIDTDYYYGEENVIDITPKLGTTEILLTSPEVSIYYAGTRVTGVTVTTPTAVNKKFAITLPTAYPAGTYYIVVSGVYNGLTYSGTKTIVLIPHVDVATFAELKDAVADSAVRAINLTENIECIEKLSVDRKIKIFSTGSKSISCATDYVFNANSGADLILKDITFGSGKAAVNVNSGASVTLDSGTIVSPNGDLVPIKSAGTLYIKEGAKIKDNTNAPRTKIGGAVYLTGGYCYMTGGEISGNTTNRDVDECSGGAMRIEDATCYISGGKIYGNSSWRGGAIYMTPATLYIYGDAEIYENTGSCQGAIYVYSTSSSDRYHSKLYMSGGSIHNNTTGSIGGGVCVEGEFYFTGGSIIDNTDNRSADSNDVHIVSNGYGAKFDATGAAGDAVIEYLHIAGTSTFDFVPGTVTIQHFTSDNSNYQYP